MEGDLDPDVDRMVGVWSGKVEERVGKGEPGRSVMLVGGAAIEYARRPVLLETNSLCDIHVLKPTDPRGYAVMML